MKIKAFKGIRPIKEKVSAVASKPYDVLSSVEAAQEAFGNPYSFLNVVKPEITLHQDTDPYSQEVYESGKSNFQKLLKEGIFVQDPQECLYIYELTKDGKSQTGIVAVASVQDYLENKIKKHELTRPDKERDRKNHVRVSMINAEPVFFAYKAVETLDRITDNIKKSPPEYEFVADDAVTHRLWKVEDNRVISQIVEEFVKMPATYVADGHHRTAAAALVGNDLKNENSSHNGEEGYNYFLAVHFPDNQLQILDYNRLVKDLNGLDTQTFLAAIEEKFEVEAMGEKPYKPNCLHEFGMYLDNAWYRLTTKASFVKEDVIGVLDVTILSDLILKPILGIHDLRTDNRIAFVGGIRGLGELEKRVDRGEMEVAFALFPVSMEQLMDIADNDLIMPPKVTWFEPKLRSGLVVYSLET